MRVILCIWLGGFLGLEIVVFFEDATDLNGLCTFLAMTVKVVRVWLGRESLGLLYDDILFLKEVSPKVVRACVVLSLLDFKSHSCLVLWNEVESEVLSGEHCDDSEGYVELTTDCKAV